MSLFYLKLSLTESWSFIVNVCSSPYLQCLLAFWGLYLLFKLKILYSKNEISLQSSSFFHSCIILYFCFLDFYFLPENPLLFVLGANFLIWNLAIVPFFIKGENLFRLILDSTVTNFKAKYYHPKFLSITQFWKENYKKRKTLNSSHDKVFKLLETLILGLISFYTAIGTRFSYLLLFFLVLWFSKLLSLTFFFIVYFVILWFLTILASIPRFQKYIKKVYYEDILNHIGWNHPRWIGTTHNLTVVKGLVSVGSFYLFDEAVSPFLNKWTIAQEQAAYRANLGTWQEHCLLANNHNLANQPIPPDVDILIARRIRFIAPEALNSLFTKK